MILVLSNDADSHTKTVIEKISRRGHEFVLFDPAKYPYQCKCSIDSRDINSASIDVGRKQIFLRTIGAIWVRRPGDFELSARLQPGESKWLNTECNHLFSSIWSNLGGFWMSHPDNIRAASRKLLQLKMASKLGFEVPEYLVTNNVGRVKAFLASFKDGVIVKALGAPTVMGDGEAATLYTHHISKKDLRHLNSVAFGPTFLQKYIQKQADIRVTVVGDTVFAVSIDSAGVEDAKSDFRRAEAFELPHTPIRLPIKLKDACLNLVQSLGLQFGAIDLLLDDRGNYYFLEINPNGQWLWIEWMTGLRIADAICDRLINADKRESKSRRGNRNRRCPARVGHLFSG